MELISVEADVTHSWLIPGGKSLDEIQAISPQLEESTRLLRSGLCCGVINSRTKTTSLKNTLKQSHSTQVLLKAGSQSEGGNRSKAGIVSTYRKEEYLLYLI